MGMLAPSLPTVRRKCLAVPTVCACAVQVQELMAAQLAFALFGWLDAPTNSLFQARARCRSPLQRASGVAAADCSAVQDAASAVSSADNKDAKQLEKQYLVQGRLLPPALPTRMQAHAC